ncbi:MAG: DNA polymerase IV [Clostridiaceae bacterium]|nr:DNA polymerase IV [Clostridiaceae bacterium]
MDRIIMHIDVNSAYLSWEAAYRKQHGYSTDLREIPSVVGGDEESRHGIVLAKSGPAKKYGIKTGETLFSARQKCSRLVVVPPNYYLYMQCHNALLEILHEFSPQVQVFSIDEAFIDYTGMQRIYGDPVSAAHILKERIKNELGFTVNIGIAKNKLLAKMAGDLKKPDMVHAVLSEEEMKEKIWPLPVKKLYGVGHATAPKLNRLNIFTIGQLAQADTELLRFHLKSWGVLIQKYANGIEDSVVSSDMRPPVKGIGNSCTSPFDIYSKEEALKVLLSLCEMVGMRLRQSGFCAKLVSVTLRGTDLKRFSHQCKTFMATDNTMKIYQIAGRLMGEMWSGKPLRGMGIRVSDLVPCDFLQISIFEGYNEKKKKLDDTIDRLRMKYGINSVFRSCFLGSGLPPVSGGVIEGYQMMTNIL